jgi:hypothetical protein
VSWQELEAGAPELARLGRARLERAGLALLGTLRSDGSPRISPVEPHLAAGELLFSAMARTGKAGDLRRDRRCALHSLVTETEGREGELKLHGRAEPVDERLRDAAPEAWWVGRPPEDAEVYTLRLEQAFFLEWDTARGLMKIRRWSPGGGYDERERPYP